MSTNIAVCISGHPRTFQKTVSTFAHLTKGVNADFFFSTWIDQADYDLPNIFSRNDLNLAAYEYVSEPFQKNYEREVLKNCSNSYPDFFIFNQWYGVERCLRLAYDYQNMHGMRYDYIVRARFDLRFKFQFKDLIKESRDNMLNFVEAQTKGSDQFLYSKPEILFKLQEFRAWLYLYAKRDGRKYGFFASPILKAYFLDMGVPVNEVEAIMHVVREDSGSAKEIREKRTKDYIYKNFEEYSQIAWVGQRVLPNLEKPTPWEKDFPGNENKFFLNGEKI